MSHQTLILTPHGPIITVHIGVAVPRAAAMRTAGVAVPSSVAANLLIDTGAGGTALDPSIINRLGITPSGTTNILTPSTGTGSHVCNTYDISMVVLAQPGHGTHKVFNALPVFECDLSAQGIDGLLGRDILSKATMFYDGLAGQVSITFS